MRGRSKMADLPLNPEPFEYSKIKKAFRAAKFAQGFGFLLFSSATFLGLMVTAFSSRIVGLAIVLISATVYGWIFMQGRCPRCGRFWGNSSYYGGPPGNELEDFVCSRCRLNIGMGLRE